MFLKRAEIILVSIILIIGIMAQSGCAKENNLKSDTLVNGETTNSAKPTNNSVGSENILPSPTFSVLEDGVGVTPTLPSTPSPSPQVTPERITYPEIITTDEIRRLDQYEDFVCWLYIENTNISNYVVQAEDNDFYIRKNIDKQQNGNGSLFMDYRCNADTWERHNIVYGHNQKNGTMFSDLIDFNDPEFFKAHPVIYTYTPRGVKIWKIFSAYETDTSFYYIETHFKDDNSYLDFIRNIQSKSVAETDVVLKKTDKILTLSTCQKEENKNGRFVVHAVLTDEIPYQS